MASRKRILKLYCWTIICFSATGFLLLLYLNACSDQRVYFKEKRTGSNTNASAVPALDTSTFIPTSIVSIVVTRTVPSSVPTPSHYTSKIFSTEKESVTTKASTEIITTTVTTQQRTTLYESSTLLSSSQSTDEREITSSVPNSPSTTVGEVNGLFRLEKIPIISFLGLIFVLLLGLVFSFCSRLKFKQKDVQRMEGSEDGWKEIELDGMPLATNTHNTSKEQNVAETDIHSAKPRLSISSPTEMRYASVNQTFATFTPGPENFRKNRDRNLRTVVTGVSKGLMYSEPDLLSNTIPSLKLSVKSAENTLRWEPNVAYQGFDPRIYHSTENYLNGSYGDDFDDEYYAVIDMQ